MSRITIASAGLLAAACLAGGCGNLAHPIGNDGPDGNSAGGANPGTSSLLITAANANLTLGDTESLQGTYGGATLINNGTFTATSSDPSVVTVGGISLWARSAGSATITATYNGSQATIGINVLPENGLSALISVLATSPPAWSPSPVRVTAGSSVEFFVGSTHNVVFDSVPGAPPNIGVGALGAALVRQFPTAGSFTYQCTVHGETGVVNVVSAP